MAKTVTQAFQELRENLEITGLQKSTVSTRQQSVREAVESSLDVLDSFLTGSYSRHTMISPLSEADVDIFMVLSSKYYSTDGYAVLLDKVKNVLLKTYPKTPKISRNGQAVTITFTDFQVDVVPAFYRTGGGYLIPNSEKKVWISTDPEVHVNLMKQENAAHNGDLVPLVKMIKGWNMSNDHAFLSFYLELLVIKILKGVTISNFPSGVRFFFDKGRELIKYTITDPAGLGSEVQGLDTIKSVKNAINLFGKSYNLAVEAERLEREGKVSLAIGKWKEIFGSYFPTYG